MRCVNIDLQKTFDVGWMQYRRMMEIEALRRVVTLDRGQGVHRKSLDTIRDELFHVRGAPPPGAAAMYAAEVHALVFYAAVFSKACYDGDTKWPCSQTTARRSRNLCQSKPTMD